MTKTSQIEKAFIDRTILQCERVPTIGGTGYIVLREFESLDTTTWETQFYNVQWDDFLYRTAWDNYDKAVADYRQRIADYETAAKKID